jgi:hypothetical protein
MCIWMCSYAIPTVFVSSHVFLPFFLQNSSKTLLSRWHRSQFLLSFFFKTKEQRTLHNKYPRIATENWKWGTFCRSYLKSLFSEGNKTFYMKLIFPPTALSRSHFLPRPEFCMDFSVSPLYVCPWQCIVLVCTFLITTVSTNGIFIL